ncbi:MAG: hypothetical protein GW886_10970 [Rhodobacterales bacterium]|nr:hypothetical protein [Rhodobacterales bacterium]NCT13257.1 hypothetical protein [Rhodobacterales bacterium]
MDSPLWSQWWVWMAAAAALGILEMLVPAWVFLGFALGAAIMGCLMATGWLTLGAAGSLLLFAVLSLAAYLVLRRLLGMKKGQVKVWTTDINDN